MNGRQEQGNVSGQGAVDLIRLADDEGNSVVVQVTGRYMPGC